MRNKITSAYQAFATDLEKERTTEELQQTEDWLYEEGEDQSADIYAKRLQDLEKLVDPIESRYKDVEARERASRAVLDTIREWKRHSQKLPPSQKDAILVACDEYEKWLLDMTEQQDSLPKNKEPVLWASHIEIEADNLKMRMEGILKSKRAQPDNDSYPDEPRRVDDMQVD